MSRDLDALRRDYQRGQLLEADAGDDPVALFDRWLDDARQPVNLSPTR
jgi:Pyridoxamine-phosphate oxidase